MLELQDLLLAASEGAGCLDHILDLSTVDLLLTELPQLFRRQTDVGRIPMSLAEECRPNLTPRIRIEVMVTKGDMYTRLEGFIKDTNTVCCQEQDAAKVSGHGYI